MKVVLSTTTNPKMQQYVGKEGDLSIADGKFCFQFVSDTGGKTLSSGIVRQLGDMKNPVSKEICFDTKNSTYIFKKKENVAESLYEWDK